jgi:hypothetical protein
MIGHMPEMTMTEAAKWAGKSRTTMFKAIKSGRISARKDDAGEYRIDPSELVRVFQPANSANDPKHVSGEQSDIAERMAALRAENTLLRDQLAKSEDREARLLGVVENQTRLLPNHGTRPNWKFWRRT